MKEILLILVGGTICTSVSDEGTLTVSKEAGSLLKSKFFESDSVFAKKDIVHIDLTENLFLLSENMTPEKWNLMLKTYRKYIRKKNYDGVIFAHGTDTLAYSASLFSLILRHTNIPIFFVSSNKRLDLSDANGNENFKYAVECICRGICPNVYVTYRNPDENVMYLHLASRLTQSANYSENFFSKDAMDITDNSDEKFQIYLNEVSQNYPRKVAKKNEAIENVKRLLNCILYIPPYVGANYDAYGYTKFKAVLHGTYHSGTACAEQTKENSKYGKNSVLRMLDVCAKKGVDVYFSPFKNEGEVYDTIRIIANHEVEGRKPDFLYGMTNEMAYAKLLLAYSVFSNKDDIIRFLNTEYNYEFIDSFKEEDK